MSEPNTRNSVVCETCGWKRKVPRDGERQPFDHARNFHVFTSGDIGHAMVMPVDDGDAQEITADELRVGAAYTQGYRRGYANARKHLTEAITDLIKEVR